MRSVGENASYISPQRSLCRSRAVVRISCHNHNPTPGDARSPPTLSMICSLNPARAAPVAARFCVKRCCLILTNNPMIALPASFCGLLRYVPIIQLHIVKAFTPFFVGAGKRAAIIISLQAGKSRGDWFAPGSQNSEQLDVFLRCVVLH